MKYILITGTSTGIGFACAKAFINKGYHVLGSVRKEADAERLEKEFINNFTPLLFDVTDEKAIKEALPKVAQIVGDNGLAGLINNAGIALGGPLLFTELSEYKRQFDVNVFGLIAVTKTFLPLLGAVENCSHSAGKIINISSVAGQVALPFLTPYCGSKHAVEAISQGLRRELLPYGIDVIIVGPGAIKTPIWTKEAAVEEITDEIKASSLGKPLKKFQKEFVKAGAAGLNPDVLANKILSYFEKKKPKTRYAVPSKFLEEWFLPRYIFSDRLFDTLIGKKLGLKKK